MLKVLIAAPAQWYEEELNGLAAPGSRQAFAGPVNSGGEGDQLRWARQVTSTRVEPLLLFGIFAPLRYIPSC